MEGDLAQYRRRKRRAPAGDADAADAAGGVDWTSLPDDILSSIAGLIPSYSDLAAFSFVCRSWRDAALAATIRPHSRPPLLLLRGKAKKKAWSAHDVASPAAHSSRRTLPILESRWTSHIAGVSRGRLILVTGSGKSSRITIVNPISGQTVRSPPFPHADLFEFRFHISAVHVNSSTIVVVLPSFGVLQWHIGAEGWALVHRADCNWYSQLTALPDGRLLVVGPTHICVLTLEPQASFTKLVPLPGEENSNMCCGLFTWDAAIMYLYLDLTFSFKFEVKVFRLVEFVSAEPKWEQLNSLGDWTIFVSHQEGVPPVMCHNPGQWGGHSGCIYFAKSSYFKYSGGNNGDQIRHVVDLADEETGISWKQRFPKPTKFGQILVDPSSLEASA